MFLPSVCALVYVRSICIFELVYMSLNRCLFRGVADRLVGRFLPTAGQRYDDTRCLRVLRVDDLVNVM